MLNLRHEFKPVLMSLLKIQSKFTRSTVFLLLTIFVVSKMVVLIHSYSHQGGCHKSIFSGQEDSSKKSVEDCLLCSFIGFQNQASFVSNVVFGTMAFCSIFALRYFDQVELFYLLSLKAARAPPVIS